MLPLLLASAIFTCDQAQQVIDNVYEHPNLPTEVQEEVIEALLEATPTHCPAHFFNSWVNHYL